MAEEEEKSVLGFHEMGLDDRLLKAIAVQNWAAPTPIQEAAIPLVLQGKDVLCRSRTGSGKTAAYALPVLQKILASKQTAREHCTKALVMTPTNELCRQAHSNITALCSSCSRDVKCVNVSVHGALDTVRPLLMERPDIVVGTPGRVLAHLNARNLDLKAALELLVIDEADQIFHHGYEDDIKTVLTHLPKIYQAILLSATLNEDEESLKSLKALVLHNPVILKLQESQLPDATQLTHYTIKCEEEDKFTLIYTLLKLRLIRGKTIVFVNTIDRCYRLKLFLEQFSIPACVLNSELPVNSRCHIVTQFNEGLYDIIIAADELMLEAPTRGKLKQKHKHKKKKDKESGVSRGIDFQLVSNVINFDFPTNVQSYIHRVGRTARGDLQGTALSFVSVKEHERLQAVEAELTDSSTGEGDSLFKRYLFKMDEIEGFKYRAKDAMRAVTSVAVKEARLKEIKTELLNSSKLKTYFEDNPRDLQLLRHDKTLHTVKIQSHLKNVPDYLVPQTLKGIRRGGKKPTRRNFDNQPTKRQKKYEKRKADPLKSFEFAGLSKKKRKK